MSYRIFYGRKTERRKKNFGFLGIIGVTVVLMAWLLAFSWLHTEHARKFREVFFPWSSSELQTAMANLKEDVHNGIPFQEAAQTFCWDLINEEAE